MIMARRLRKLALIAHITSSVGWMGAVAAYLALAVVAVTRQDAPVVRAAYLAMEVVASVVIVPLALGSLLTGLISSLGTHWGLFRHYWVLIKFVITILATIVLLLQLEPISYLADVARAPTVSSAARREAAGQVLHAGGGLLVLLMAQVLSVYKPRGMTRYGQRKQDEQRPGRVSSRSTMGRMRS